MLIAGNDGQIHKTTLNEQLTQQYAGQVPQLAALARSFVRDLDPQVKVVLWLLVQHQHDSSLSEGTLSHTTWGLQGTGICNQWAAAGLHETDIMFCCCAERPGIPARTQPEA